MTMYYVYLLKLKNGYICTGSTPDLERRVSEHRNGKSEATKNFRPLKLIWYCAFETSCKRENLKTILRQVRDKVLGIND